MSGDLLDELVAIETAAEELGVELPDLPFNPDDDPLLTQRARLFGALGRELGTRGYDVGGRLADARWNALLDALRAAFADLGHELDVDAVEARALDELLPEFVAALRSIRDAEAATSEAVRALAATGTLTEADAAAALVGFLGGELPAAPAVDGATT